MKQFFARVNYCNIFEFHDSTPVIGENGRPVATRTAPDGGEKIDPDMVSGVLVFFCKIIHHQSILVVLCPQKIFSN